MKLRRTSRDDVLSVNLQCVASCRILESLAQGCIPQDKSNRGNLGEPARGSAITRQLLPT